MNSQNVNIIEVEDKPNGDLATDDWRRLENIGDGCWEEDQQKEKEATVNGGKKTA